MVQEENFDSESEASHFVFDFSTRHVVILDNKRINHIGENLWGDDGLLKHSLRHLMFDDSALFYPYVKFEKFENQEERAWDACLVVNEIKILNL